MQKLAGVLAVGACVFGVNPSGWAQESKDGSQPFTVTGMQVLIHYGKNLSVITGKNDLDKAGMLTCSSAAGCTIAISATATVYGSGGGPWTFCTEVDGINAEPLCKMVQPTVGNSLQSLDVGQGTHKVKTLLRDLNGPETVINYEIQYTLYDH